MKSWALKIALSIAMVAVLVVGLIEPPNPFYVPPVQAAPVEPVSIVMCVKIATTGPLDFYYCETDFGNFFVNSAGFMALEN